MAPRGKVASGDGKRKIGAYLARMDKNGHGALTCSGAAGMAPLAGRTNVGIEYAPIHPD
jgi:hypothetical protein